MSGVDTVKFDENDPVLMAELRELGFDDGGSSTSQATARPGAHRVAAGGRHDVGGEEQGGPGARRGPVAQLSKGDMFRSLGLSMRSVDDKAVRGG